MNILIPDPITRIHIPIYSQLTLSISNRDK
jgi:hypothetical protein